MLKIDYLAAVEFDGYVLGDFDQNQLSVGGVLLDGKCYTRTGLMSKIDTLTAQGYLASAVKTVISEVHRQIGAAYRSEPLAASTTEAPTVEVKEVRWEFSTVEGKDAFDRFFADDKRFETVREKLKEHPSIRFTTEVWEPSGPAAQYCIK